MRAVGQTDVDQHFLRCISVDDRGVYAIDRRCEDMFVIDPYECHAPGRRSDKELTTLLALLDNLEEGKATTR